MAYAGAVLGGRYVLDEQIGTGGYGEVWRAADTVLSRPVAIKLLHPRHAGQGETVARFRAEARHAAALSHENIAQVYDYGEAADGQPPYLVMELVAGASLEAVLDGGPLDATKTMDIVAQTAAGLQVAHAAGMVHRDIKPGNLLLTQSGTVKITDFGLAHTIGSVSVTVSGELVGTPGYLAPERAVGERAGPASDLYSLGIVAYECLTGTRPFIGTPLEVALAHRDRPLPPLPASVAADVTAFVMQLTAKDPAQPSRDAAEVTMWAGLLRDGIGAASVTAHGSAGCPAAGPGPGPSPRDPRLRLCRGRRRHRHRGGERHRVRVPLASGYRFFRPDAFLVHGTGVARQQRRRPVLPPPRDEPGPASGSPPLTSRRPPWSRSSARPTRGTTATAPGTAAEWGTGTVRGATTASGTGTGTARVRGTARATTATRAPEPALFSVPEQ